MNEPNTPQNTPPNDPAIEARIVAMVLGEASPFEKEELERLIREQPALADFERDMRSLHSLASSAYTKADDAAWKLAPDRRRKFLEEVGQPAITVVQTDHQKVRSIWTRPSTYGKIAAVLAILALIAGLLMPAVTSVRRRSILAKSGISDPRALESEKWNYFGRSSDRAGKELAYAEPKNDPASPAAAEQPGENNVGALRAEAALALNEQAGESLGEAQEALAAVEPGSDSRHEVTDASPESPARARAAQTPASRLQLKSQARVAESRQYAMKEAQKLASQVEELAQLEDMQNAVDVVEPLETRELAQLSQQLASADDAAPAPRSMARGSAMAAAEEVAEAKAELATATEEPAQMNYAMAMEQAAAQPAADADPQDAFGYAAGGQIANGSIALTANGIPDGVVVSAKPAEALQQLQEAMADEAAAMPATPNTFTGSTTLAGGTLGVDSDYSDASSLGDIPVKGQLFRGGGGRGEGQGNVPTATAKKLEDSSREAGSGAKSKASQFEGTIAYGTPIESAPAQPAPPAVTTSPAVAGLSSASSDFKSNTEGRDVLSEPAVAVRSGERAIIEATRDLAYPGDVFGAGAPAQEPVELMKNSLAEAKDFAESGRYDMAMKRADEVLSVDPYNTQARRLKQEVNKEREKYARETYDERRSRMVWEETHKWQSPVRKFGIDAAGEADAPQDVAGKAYVKDKLSKIIIPKIQFQDATVSEALEFLKRRSRELDGVDANPAHKGVEIDYEATDVEATELLAGAALPGAEPGVKNNTRITLSLSDIPLGDALKYIASLSSQKVKVTEGGVEIIPLSEPTDVLITKEYRVSPEQLGAAGSGDFKAYFESQGIPFPPGSAAELIQNGGRLIVRNTTENVELIDVQLEQLSNAAANKPASGSGIEDTMTSDSPVSTFSLHVADTSFEMAASALLNERRLPDPSTIRTEEFVNAIDYCDPAPAGGEPVALAQDQAAHPFIPGRNLVRISARTASSGRAASQPLRLTILLDKSGSMDRPDRSKAARDALSAVVELLKPADTVSLVAFDSTARLALDRTPGNEAAQRIDETLKAVGESGTNLESAMDLATEVAVRQFDSRAQNRVVLITDGVANLGNTLPDSLAAKVHSLRGKKIAFDVVGVGTKELADTVLETMARNGDGRYFVLSGSEETAKDFADRLAGAFRPAATDVKIQVRFNPSRVAAYSLLGFKEHRLKEEDFRNDSVDAAELAAAEDGTAVYQVRIDPAGSGEIGQAFIRFRDTSTGEIVERNWVIPYEQAAPSLDSAEPAIQLAATSALFAEKLAGTAIGQSVELDALTKIALQAQGQFPASDRVTKLTQMLRAASDLTSH